MQNMTEYEIKQLMCDIGKRVWEKGMVAANDGNFVRFSLRESSATRVHQFVFQQDL